MTADDKKTADTAKKTDAKITATGTEVSKAKPTKKPNIPGMSR